MCDFLVENLGHILRMPEYTSFDLLKEKFEGILTLAYHKYTMVRINIGTSSRLR
jgi:hypothetical protein